MELPIVNKYSSQIYEDDEYQKKFQKNSPLRSLFGKIKNNIKKKN